jgi:hypothetical protein
MPNNKFINIVMNENTKTTSNNEYRINKINKYINKRTKILNNFITKFPITIPITELIKWYDLFYDYSIMGKIEESKYWIIMIKLNNSFACWNRTIHSILFNIYCTNYLHHIEIP